jgi:hypothetical protein
MMHSSRDCFAWRQYRVSRWSASALLAGRGERGGDSKADPNAGYQCQ